MRFLISLFTTLFLAVPVFAGGDLTARDGWSVTPTSKTFDALVKDTRTAVKANGMGVVTQAGPTAAAKKRGIKIPGNRVIGVFNNNYAVKVLETSTAAMIEAPIRMYVTENEDGTATLSYKTPTTVFTPYLDEGGTALALLSTQLDAIFAQIAADAGNETN
jgi:uncharacterized protein (DUF302 family)